MVDATDLIVIASVVQTVVITLTLLVFIFQFRGQERAIRESSYQNLLGRYNDFVMSTVASPEASDIFSRRLSDLGRKEVTPQEAAICGRLLIACGIVEEAHALYRKGWIDKDNWQQWANWLKALSAAPEFGLVRIMVHGTFDKEFEDFIATLRPPSAPPGA